jgi:hypothetical protein
MPILFAEPTLSSLSKLSVVLAWLITIYAGSRLWWLAVEGRDRTISLTFWLFVYVWLGLGALANTVSQQFPLFHQTFNEGTQVSALATIIVGLVGYELGRQICRAHRTTRKAGQLLNVPTVSPRRIAILGFSGMCTAVYFTAKFGLAARFSSRATQAQAFLGSQAGSGSIEFGPGDPSASIQQALDWVLPFLGLYLLLYQRRTHRDAQEREATPARRRFWRKVFILGLIGAVILADNPMSNPRAVFGGVAIALLLAVWALNSARRVRVLAAILVASALVLYPLANAFRYTGSGFHLAPLNTEFRTNADFSMFQQELNAQVYVASHGHTWGRQLLGTVFSWVPRSDWPGKPGSTGNLILGVYADVLAASLSIFGWAFVDGGIVWVFLVLAGYGWASGSLEEAYRRRPLGRLSFAAAATPLFAAFQVLLLRGDLLPEAGQLAPVGLALIAACTFSRRTRPNARDMRHRPEIDSTQEPAEVATPIP